jgi:hypothetical protein
MSADWTTRLDEDNCDDEEVVALVYEIGRRRGSDADRHMWTVRRDHDEPVPADQARDAYRTRRDGRTNR